MVGVNNLNFVKGVGTLLKIINGLLLLKKDLRLTTNVLFDTVLENLAIQISLRRQLEFYCSHFIWKKEIDPPLAKQNKCDRICSEKNIDQILLSYPSPQKSNG